MSWSACKHRFLFVCFHVSVSTRVECVMWLTSGVMWPARPRLLLRLLGFYIRPSSRERFQCENVFCFDFLFLPFLIFNVIPVRIWFLTAWVKLCVSPAILFVSLFISLHPCVKDLIALPQSNAIWQWVSSSSS